MPTQDEEIARHLREALASGELAGTKGFGKPFSEDEGWNATPESLRMPFKILKNAGYVPPEVELSQERAALSASLGTSTSEAERVELRSKLSDLQQKIALRLDATYQTVRSERGHAHPKGGQHERFGQVGV